MFLILNARNVTPSYNAAFNSIKNRLLAQVRCGPKWLHLPYFVFLVIITLLTNLWAENNFGINFPKL